MRTGCSLILAALLLSGLPCAGLASSFAAANVGMFPGAAPTQAYLSEIPDLNDFVWNPAGLSYLTRSQASAGYMDYLASLKGGIAAFGAPLRPGLGYSVFLSYLSTGQVVRTDLDDPTGARGETFTFGELVGGISAGMRLSDAFSAGGALKLAREQMDEDFGTGLLADIGASYKLFETGMWPGAGTAAYATVTGRNLLIAHDIEGAESPSGLEAGISLSGSGGTSYSGGLSFYFGRNGLQEARAGVVGLLSDEFRARLGYRRRVGRNSDASAGFSWMRGLTAGFGVRFGRVWVDYTYEDSSPLDAIHRFGLTFLGTQAH
jgi:hypothetical protein